MTVFIRLVLAYLLADFVIFRERIFNLKQKNKIAGYLLHAAIYAALILLLCLPYMDMTWLNIKSLALNGWQTLPLLALAHILIGIADKSESKTCGVCRTVAFLLWQIVAVSILFLVFPLLGVQQTLEVNYCWENFLIISAGALFATYFISTLVYFIEKDLSGEDKPVFDVKYTSMLMRLALYLLLLAPGLTGWLLGGLWIIFYFVAGGIDVSPARKFVGLPLAVAIAVLVKFVI